MIESFINSTGFFDRKEILEVVSYFNKQEFKSGEFLAREGQEHSEIGFIGSGAFHLFKIIDNEEITVRFACKGSFVSAYSSLITRTKSKESIQCIQDAEIWTISHETISNLADDNLAWSKLIGLASDIQYLELEKYALEKNIYSAKDRYEKILQEHPQCILETPMKHLASYLGISPRHLSRIRKE